MRRSLPFVILALAHFAASISLLAVSFAMGMARFDSGAAPGAAERLLDVACAILVFPLVPMVAALPGVPRPVGPPWEHLVFLANSALWAGVATWAIGRWRQRRLGRSELAEARL